MKVICVKKGNGTAEHPCVVGDIYTVVECAQINGAFSYRFEELPFIQTDGKSRWYQWYAASRFIPLDAYKEEQLQELKAELNFL